MYPHGYGYIQGNYGYDYSQYWMASAASYAVYSTANSGLHRSSTSQTRSSSSDSNSSSSSSSSSGSADTVESADLCANPNKGKKGDYTSLLDEMKAKQKLRDQQRSLQQRLSDTESRRKRDVLQERLHAVENELRQMGESMVTILDSNTGRLRSSRTFGHEPSDFRQPGDDRADQFARLLHAVEEHLRSRDGHSSTISEVEENSKVRREWADLQQSRIVASSIKLKHVLQERKHLFKISRGIRGRTQVSLAGAGSGKRGQADKQAASTHSSNSISSPIASVASKRAAAKSEALAVAAAAERGVGRYRTTEVAILEAEASLPEGGLLRPDQVSAIEAHLESVGGEERVSRLSSLFNVDKAQLRPHFQLYDKAGKLLAAPKPKQEESQCSHLQRISHKGASSLESLLQKLTTSRASIGEAMAFCLDAAAQQAAPLARTLVKALEEPDLRTEKIIARLYLISDVLHNAGALAKGASRYRTSFQELLPDAFERLGRTWFHRIKRRQREHGRDWAERGARKVLEAWRHWQVFPSLYLRGLQALLFAPVPEGDALNLEGEGALEQRIARWCSTADAARLPYAARLRGLAGSALPISVCRARLCHFERYWYHAGVESTREEEDDPWGEALRPTSTWSVPAELGWQASTRDNEDLDGQEILSIDGESCSDVDLLENELEDDSQFLSHASSSANRLYDSLLSPCKRQRLSDPVGSTVVTEPVRL